MALPTRTLTPTRRRIVLVRDGHRWVFEWNEGDEPAVVDHVVRLVHAEHVEFDWYDAAVVCRQLGRRVPEAAGPPPAA